MRWQLGAFLATLVLCLAASAIVATRPALAGPNCSVDATIDSEEQVFLQLINQHRQQNGLPALKLSTTLNKAAAWKSEHMAESDYFATTTRRSAASGSSGC